MEMQMEMPAATN